MTPVFSDFIYQIGYGSYVDGKTINGSFVDQAHLSIGRFCSIASGLNVVLGGNHITNWASTFPFETIFNDVYNSPQMGTTKGDIIIGHDVWIGFNVNIMSGVTIGSGACIGAYSVVTHDIPPYAIAAGNPCKVKKYRFSPEVIERLLKLAWWDWPLDKIQKAVPWINSKDIKLFLNTYEGET